MAKNLLDNSKKYLKFYYNSDGTWVDEPDHKWNAKSVSPEAIKFVSDFFRFLMNSTFLCKYSIMWLNSNLNSMRAMVEAYNNQVEMPDKLVLHTVTSSIDYDKRKLKKYFSVDMLDEVFAYPETYLDTNIEILDNLQRQYMQDKQYTQALVIKIPKRYIEKTIDDRSWALLTQLLTTYSKNTVDNISNGTDPLYTENIFGYYNYLISSSKLNKEEQKRLNEIKSILGVN